MTSTIEEDFISNMVDHEQQQFIPDELFMDISIHDNIKWGIRGMAMFLLPVIIGMVPLVENKLRNIFCAKGKRVFNAGFTN